MWAIRRLPLNKYPSIFHQTFPITGNRNPLIGSSWSMVHYTAYAVGTLVNPFVSLTYFPYLTFVIIRQKRVKKLSSSIYRRNLTMLISFREITLENARLSVICKWRKEEISFHTMCNYMCNYALSLQWLASMLEDVIGNSDYECFFTVCIIYLEFIIYILLPMNELHHWSKTSRKSLQSSMKVAMRQAGESLEVRMLHCKILLCIIFRLP